jgi:hypothetical protein
VFGFVGRRRRSLCSRERDYNLPAMARARSIDVVLAAVLGGVAFLVVESIAARMNSKFEAKAPTEIFFEEAWSNFRSGEYSNASRLVEACLAIAPNDARCEGVRIMIAQETTRAPGIHARQKWIDANPWSRSLPATAEFYGSYPALER